MLYRGARAGRIIGKIISDAKDPLVLIGAPDRLLEKLEKYSHSFAAAQLTDSRNIEQVTDSRNVNQHSGSRTADRRVQKRGLRIERITAKTSPKNRMHYYRSRKVVCVTEHIFLIDLLKQYVPSEKVRVIYLLGPQAAESNRNIRNFIFFSAQTKIHVVLVWSRKYSFPEIVERSRMPPSCIFLYPNFHTAVQRSLGDFEISEVRLPLDSIRAHIQAEIHEVARKMTSFPGHSIFSRYIEWTKYCINHSVSVLFNLPATSFLAAFKHATSLAANRETLCNMYGTPASEHDGEIKYASALSWLEMEEIESICLAAEKLAASETEPPKVRATRSLLSKYPDRSFAILAHDLPELSFQNPRPKSTAVLASTMRKLALRPSPHVILLNYTQETLVRLKMQREKWRRQGVDINVSIITVLGSLEELGHLEAAEEEKNAFITAIGIKQNRPAELDKAPQPVPLGVSSPPRISIDLRELRSSLPCYLAKKYASTALVEFATLKHGDYVLNHTYYIERKEMGDFMGSLSSGRLFKQMQSIRHGNRTPYLLLEFPEGEKISALRYAAQRHITTDPVSRIVALLRTLVHVKIFFSNAERMSSALIHALLRKTAAPRKGQIKHADILSAAPAVTESLISVPGVTYSNIQNILSAFSNLHDLATATRDRVVSALGPAEGQKAYDFFNATSLGPAK